MGSALLLLLGCALLFAPVAVYSAELFIYQKLIVGDRRRQNSSNSIEVEHVGGGDSGSGFTQEAETWSVQLYHRDSLPAFQQDVRAPDASPMSEELKRDAARVESITRREQLAAMAVKIVNLKPSSNQSTTEISQEEAESPIISGASVGSGEYFTRVGLGTPPKQVLFVLDTGSDMSWAQCAPCNRCYKQRDPLFNPETSSSFRYVSCGVPLCTQLQISACRRNQCLYQVSYGDGSFTVGNFAQETFTLGGGTFRDIGIGCGRDNEGLFVGADGLLGLGSGRLSFPSQIRSDFSYCLAGRFSGKTSQLIVGRGAVPIGSRFTPLIRNARLGSFYFVSLEGISVGGHLLSVSRNAFGVQSSGAGGVILDSGTAVTRLISTAYLELRDTFKAGAAGMTPAAPFSLFDTCYNLEGLQAVDVPTIDLHFAGGATMQLPPANYLVPVDSAGTYCLAFAPTTSQLSIIGNMQQQGFRISFSTRSSSSRVGFAPNQC